MKPMTFAELVEAVRERPREELEEVRSIIDRLIIEARREEILENARESYREHQEGRLKSSSDVNELMSDVDELIKRYPVIIERDTETGYLVGYIPNIAGAHSQGRDLEELRANLREVIDMLLEDDELTQQSELVAIEEIVA